MEDSFYGVEMPFPNLKPKALMIDWAEFVRVGDDDSGPEDVRMMRILSVYHAYMSFSVACLRAHLPSYYIFNSSLSYIRKEPLDVCLVTCFGFS